MGSTAREQMTQRVFEGRWWDAQHQPSKRAAGRLELAPDGTLTLTTDAAIGRDVRLWPFDRLIHGVAEGKRLTLFDARHTGNQSWYSGDETERHTWAAPYGVVGGHLPADQRFSGVELTSEHLDFWIDADLWTEDQDGSVRIDAFPSYRTAVLSDGTLSVIHDVGGNLLSRKRRHLTRLTRLNITWNSAAPITAVAAHIRHFDSLMDVVFGAASSAVYVVVLVKAGPPSNAQPLELVGTLAPGRFAEVSVEPIWHQLCTWHEFHDADGLGAWFGMDETTRYLAARLASHYRAEGRYVDDKAMTALAAGEAIDRKETGAKKAYAKTRWKRLAQAVPEFSSDFALPNVDDWVDHLVTTRNDIAHARVVDTSDQTASRTIATSIAAQQLTLLSLFRVIGLGSLAPGMQQEVRWRDIRDQHRHWLQRAGWLP